MQEARIYIEYSARALEILGIATIIVGTILAMVKFIFGTQLVKPRSYKILRQELGKAILLGLEILVAGDIIATVVTDPTLEGVTILAIIVLIRTFLSLSIQLEIEGKFPWQKDSPK
ncbi:DUF1622 domain-containing protein [Cyclobacterium jeungdonense]|uniref:DUF1622 domain-containing protein n=1 Tax=Cyclobacterium jeungdonense TaxID=708087 RepID=A0ABT8C9N3_9BACT|nr:DUF1622 domain-containing protein [Cyclobacterium jeungdonense]MDN3689514.1 DUF1622 domain-containing protein [Cyclobacterium jeungdonense]